jgi:hypothetical protein
MSIRSNLAGVGIGGLSVLAIFAGNAQAVAGARPFNAVYPVASALCAKATAGTLPKRLEASQSQVLIACTTLSGGFTTLTGNVTAAETTYTKTRTTEQADVTAVCPPATSAGRQTCRTTRLTARATDAQARLTRHDAVVLYSSSVEANRMTFWTTIQGLR